MKSCPIGTIVRTLGASSVLPNNVELLATGTIDTVDFDTKAVGSEIGDIQKLNGQNQSLPDNVANAQSPEFYV
ncbi:MAG: hypothetical protein ACON4O_02045 [Lentimonas sp.]